MARPSKALQQAQAKIAEIEGQLSQAGAQLVESGEAVDRFRASYDAVRKERDEAVNARNTAQAAQRGAEADNDNLRDQCHFLELQKARLEGQLDRVREFDPVTEQQHLRSGLAGVDRYANNSEGHVVSGGHGAPQWYRRG